MISFRKLVKPDGKATIWKIKSDHGKEFDLHLLPKNSITRKFKEVTSGISAMSKVLGEDFDQYIFELLSDYRLCTTDDEKLEFIECQSELIAGYASIFIDKNGVDYSALIAADETIGGSTFPFELEIKRLMKISGALKIGSLLFNTSNGPSNENLLRFLNLLGDPSQETELAIRVIRMLEALDGAYDEEKMITSISTRSGRIRMILPAKEPYEPSFGIIDAAAIIVRRLSILKHDSNPIRYFRVIIGNVRRKRWPKASQQGIKYVDYEKAAKEDKRVRTDQELCNMAVKYDLGRLISATKPRLLEAIRVSSEEEDKRGEKGNRQSPKERLDAIQYLPPFWRFLIVPLLVKMIGIRHDFQYDHLIGIHPTKAVFISYYIGKELQSIFGDEHSYLFEFAFYFPKSESKDTTKYRLRNIAHFINTTIKLTSIDLMKYGWGSRIHLARYIEQFVGTTKSAPLFHVLTGQKISVDAQKLEKDAIDFISRFFFTGERNTIIDQLEDRVVKMLPEMEFPGDLRQ